MTRLSALLLAAALVAPALAASTPTVSFDAARLGLPGRARAVPALPKTDAPDFAAPAHVAATFGPQDDDVRELDVYPVAALLARFPAREDGVADQISGLRRAVAAGKLAPGALLPFLPTAYAGQVLRAAVRPLAFGGGRGLRALVAYSSDVSPLSRAQVFYTFQGLTDDGKRYVSFRFPVALRELPADPLAGEGRTVMDALNAGGDRAGQVWTAYLARTARRLDALTDDARLTRLDAFVRSVRVR